LSPFEPSTAKPLAQLCIYAVPERNLKTLDRQMKARAYFCVPTIEIKRASVIMTRSEQVSLETIKRNCRNDGIAHDEKHRLKKFDHEL
jgi:hypothetical protein